jgi:hypothetical protein
MGFTEFLEAAHMTVSLIFHGKKTVLMMVSLIPHDGQSS